MQPRQATLFRICALVLLLVGALPAFADTVTGSAGSAFRTWVSGNLDEDGKPYWDTTSFDGSHESIGYLLAGLTPGISLPPGAIPFWGQSYNSGTDTGGAADSNFYFNRTGSGIGATMKLEISAHHDFNQFGWYNVANPSTATVLFSGSAGEGASLQFTPSAQYGFFLVAKDGGVYYTQSSLNPAAETGHQHFALFQQSATPGQELFWLGVEDLTLAQLNGGEGVVGDYNDLIIKLQSIPEASPLVLLLLGTTVLGFAVVRGQGSRVR